MKSSCLVKLLVMRNIASILKQKNDKSCQNYSHSNNDSYAKQIANKGLQIFIPERFHGRKNKHIQGSPANNM